jgi:hypothetical protein
MGSMLNNIVNVALTAVGGAFGGPIGMMVAQMAKQLIMGVVDKLIEQLPIPQEFKDLLQAAFHAGMGDIGGAIKNANEFVGQLGADMGGSPADVGSMQRSLDDFKGNVQQMLTQMITQFGLDREDGDSGGGTAKQGAAARGKGGGGAAGGAAAGGAAGGAGGGSAAGGASSSGGAGAGGAAGWLRAMAEALGKKLDELADEMTEAAENIDKEDPSTSVRFQVISQQFGIVMNAASTAIKSVGEGMTSMARKQ